MLQDYSQYYDIINFHSYSNDDKGITETTEYIKERMAHYGVSKPMWITETNTDFSPGGSDWENENARDVLKMYARAFGEGVERVFWFAFVGAPLPEEDPVNGIEPKHISLGWSLKGSSEFNPRQAYYTYKLMTSKLSEFDSVEKISDAQYKFTFSDNNPVYVLWGEGESLPSEITGTVKVTDYLENEETKDASDIALDEDPVFIEKLLLSRGDVNGDGTVDVLDVVRVVNIILQIEPPTDYELWAAECNGDENIDILDVVGIVNVILGTGTCAP